MKSYPYIQSKSKPHQGKCSVCSKDKIIITLEWRIDWFQGNCENEDICQSCFDKRESQEQKKREAYERKMAPIWERQRIKRQKEEDTVRKMIGDMGGFLMEYPNGQWAIEINGKTLDWWTTTGTAIERKSKKEYVLYFSNPNEIAAVLRKLDKK